MNFCNSSGLVCWMSSRYSIVLLPISSAKEIFSTSWRDVASGASAGSSEVTACPSAGPFTFTNTRPRRLATYSISVVLPYPGGEMSSSRPLWSVRLSSPAAPSCLARLSPISGRYDSSSSRLRTNPLITFGRYSSSRSRSRSAATSSLRRRWKSR